MISRRGLLAAAAAFLLVDGGRHALAGNGKGGGNGNNGGGNGNAANNGQATGKSSNATVSPGSAENARKRDTSAGSIAVRHQNGIEEVLSRDRYIMRDRRGRTIIDRPATSMDRSRLRRLKE